MNIYKVSRIAEWDYDEYSDFVVVAANVNDAYHTHPRGHTLTFTEEYSHGWVTNIDDLKIELLGVANEEIKAGVVCVSYHAG